MGSGGCGGADWGGARVDCSGGEGGSGTTCWGGGCGGSACVGGGGAVWGGGLLSGGGGAHASPAGSSWSGCCGDGDCSSCVTTFFFSF